MTHERTESSRPARWTTLEEAEDAYWRRHALWNRWLPFLGNPTTLWIGVSLLALWAIKRRRDRDRKLAEAWEAEELLVESMSGDSRSVGDSEPIN